MGNRSSIWLPTFRTKAADGCGFFLSLANREPEWNNQARLSLRCLRYVFQDSGSALALLRLLLSIMAGAHRGFGFPGRKSSFPLVIF